MLDADLTDTLSAADRQSRYKSESLGGLGHEELAPPARTDRILHHLARSRRHELDAVRALLPVIWMVLIFGGFMGDFRLREQFCATAFVEMMAPAISGKLFNNERRQTPLFIELDEFVM